MKNLLAFLLRYLRARQLTPRPGQGVIEYAGAMIVAALIVMAVLTIGQSSMTNIYNSIFNGVQGFFNTQSSNL
jgi:hypothetical protein